ncbi:NlpC/P60 family protein [Mycobacterium paraintracellulare]|uniref:NlpC/P60 family protein n=1 Tax=Mycobacterium paraintracellulare TaxID=1138383 RepID=UPI0019159809|nr:NlpC/P60 family protein [Mycobacterium paraintracellulare]
MRRTRWGSSARPTARLLRPVVPSVLSVALLVCTPGLAEADPAADNLAALIANVAKANQRLQNLSAEIQTEQESVNKALVDVETARDNVATAQHDLETSQQAVKDANAAIAGAQQRFNTFAAAAYMNGPSSSYLTASSPDDIIATEAAAKSLTASSQTVMAKLQQARTEQLNKESAARLAKQNADKAAADAKSSQDAAVAALTNSRQKFDEQREDMIRLAAERNQAQAKLEAAKREAAARQGSGGSPASGGVGGRIPRVYGRQATEYVIRRGMSQIGVPYSWGGGNAAGPSKGIDSGAGITGFDCSGLVLYSFAGVGIKLPHYSGSQYNLGRKIPSSQMRRGDVIFYGPGGSQHVTIYLGDGQMLEAPDIGLKVRVAPVRTSGMTPYVVRYIEW